MPFKLHPRLAADTMPVSDWPLCAVLLMNDRRFPWLILVPRREGLREPHELPEQERLTFWTEVSQASRLLQARTNAFKMNVAALGNLVPQLHVHVIARFESDAAWPRPVWGVGEAEPYPRAEARNLIEVLRTAWPS